MFFRIGVLAGSDGGNQLLITFCAWFLRVVERCRGNVALFLSLVWSIASIMSHAIRNISPALLTYTKLSKSLGRNFYVASHFPILTYAGAHEPPAGDKSGIAPSTQMICCRPVSGPACEL